MIKVQVTLTDCITLKFLLYMGLQKKKKKKPTNLAIKENQLFYQVLRTKAFLMIAKKAEDSEKLKQVQTSLRLIPLPLVSNKYLCRVQFSSVQCSHSVVSKSLRPHESQHARPPCPSPTPGVHSDSRPLSQ